MRLRVRYVECDMQGRVFNGHYLTWIDMAHTEALGEIAGGYQGLTQRGIDDTADYAKREWPQWLRDRLAAVHS